MNPKQLHRVAAVGLLVLLCVSAAFAQISNPSASLNRAMDLVYFGTYTGAKSKGIYVSRLDHSTGKLTNPELAVETTNPSFLAIHPGQRLLYAVGEIQIYQGKKSGVVSAFSIDSASGKLTLLNQQPSGGGAPCHLVVDKTGRNVLLANYSGGSVAVLPIGTDGKLGEATAFIQHTGSGAETQGRKAPHAHSINLDAANRFAFAADLGLDQVLVYQFDANKGDIVPHVPPFATVNPGAGPRHFAIHPNQRFAYVINEKHCTVTAFSYDAQRGKLRDLQTISTLPDGISMRPEFSTAEVQVHPSGRFLYGSNRGHDSIAVFVIGKKTGRLTLIQNQPTQGKTPRNFGINSTGDYLLVANQDSDRVVVFRIDPKTGRLTPTRQSAEVGAPACVKFLKVNRS